MLGLCRTQGFYSCRDQGYSLVAVHGLLTVVASLVAEYGLNRAGSIAVEHRLRCPVACGIVLDRGWKLCPLHWQADSQPLDHQGSPPYSLLSTSVSSDTGLLRWQDGWPQDHVMLQVLKATRFHQSPSPPLK